MHVRAHTFNPTHIHTHEQTHTHTYENLLMQLSLFSVVNCFRQSDLVKKISPSDIILGLPNLTMMCLKLVLFLLVSSQVRHN